MSEEENTGKGGRENRSVRKREHVSKLERTVE